MSLNESLSLSEKEKLCLDFLRTAHSLALALDELNPNDLDDFEHAIRTAQNIILSRPVVRLMADTDDVDQDRLSADPDPRILSWKEESSVPCACGRPATHPSPHRGSCDYDPTCDDCWVPF